MNTFRLAQDGKGALVSLESPTLGGFMAAAAELHKMLGSVSILAAGMNPETLREMSREVSVEDVSDATGEATVTIRWHPSDKRQPTERWDVRVKPDERIAFDKVLFRLGGFH